MNKARDEGEPASQRETTRTNRNCWFNHPRRPSPGARPEAVVIVLPCSARSHPPTAYSSLSILLWKANSGIFFSLFIYLFIFQKVVLYFDISRYFNIFQINLVKNLKNLNFLKTKITGEQLKELGNACTIYTWTKERRKSIEKEKIEEEKTANPLRTGLSAFYCSAGPEGAFLFFFLFLLC